MAKKVQQSMDNDLRSYVNIPAGGDVGNLQSRVGIVESSLAENTNIKGTIQNTIFNADGTVQKVQHVDSVSVVIREDVFTYADNLITEVRTLSNGGSLTFKYHLDTLSVEVI
jgi:hypothetical protein